MSNQPQDQEQPQTPTPKPAPEPAPGPIEVQAVVDRLEEGMEDALYAVLLVGEAETELILPAHRLPRGTREGSWLRLTLVGERVLTLVADEAETATRRDRIQTKRAALKRRPRKLKPRGE